MKLLFPLRALQRRNMVSFQWPTTRNNLSDLHVLLDRDCMQSWAMQETSYPTLKKTASGVKINCTSSIARKHAGETTQAKQNVHFWMLYEYVYHNFIARPSSGCAKSTPKSHV